MHIFVLFIVLFFGSMVSVSAESVNIEDFSVIDRIIIHVRSCEVEITGRQPDGSIISRKYLAGTPTVKNSKDIPFGLIGWAYKITLNPGYTPTKSHIAKEKKSGKKVRTDYSPGDKDNPLGNIKIYFTFSGINPEMSFGMHTTNKPDSIGHRASEGCARLQQNDAQDISRIILLQNGYDAESLFQEMFLQPSKQIKNRLTKRPEVVYLND